MVSFLPKLRCYRFVQMSTLKHLRYPGMRTQKEMFLSTKIEKKLHLCVVKIFSTIQLKNQLTKSGGILRWL